ncbi:MAG: GFA family protein [Cyanobacteria bacterium J06623_7]
MKPHVGYVRRFPSSEWAERGFCSKCGTHLFYWLKQNNHYYVPVGIFERQDNFVFDHQIFIDRKPEYFAFANDTSNMTEAEVLTMFGNLAGTP